MAAQYPYALEVQTLSSQSVQNETGDYVAAISSWEEVSPCRDEANGGGSVVQLTDGTKYVYDSLIQLPTSCPLLTDGSSIRVRQGERIRLTGTVKRFQSDQLHSRLWV